MKTFKLPSLLLLLFAFFITTTAMKCETETQDTSDEIDKTIDDVTEDLNQAAKDLKGGLGDALNSIEDAVGELSEGGEIKKPINFRKMKDLFAEDADDFKRVSAGGESSGYGKLKVSKVNTKYEDGDKRADFELIDAGSVGSAFMGAVAWSMIEVDKEDDRGFERTSSYKGHKAYEKCRNDRCEFSVFVVKRFLLNVKSRNMSIEELQDLVDELDLIDELEDLKDVEGE